MAQTSTELKVLARPPATAKTSTAFRTSSPVPSSLQENGSATALQVATGTPVTSKGRTVAIIASVTLITAISTLLNGLTTVALPTLATELSIPPSLQLWPTSIQALTNGCTLLLSGTIADALGPRFMYLLGSILQAGCILGCGLSRNAAEIIFFRGLSGIALSLCLPSAVSIITGSFEGKRRNFAFAFMGGGQPVGFSVGLALGGVLTDTIGWRYGFYISAILDMIIFGVALWGLPSALDKSRGPRTQEGSGWSHKLQRLKHEIDWLGALIASTASAMLLYTLAAISGNIADIHHPTTIALLCSSIALIPAFVVWVGRQESLGKPATIPNSLWKNKVFTSVCIAVFLTWGSFNALETILTFYFQRVQSLSAIQASIRFLPAPVAGTAANIIVGLLVHRVKANYLVWGGCALSAIAPLVMVPANVHSTYWSTAFLANCFNAIGADALFTIANLLITSVFPARTQALAGGVFNTVSQIGKAVGLALVAVIAASTTAKSDFINKETPEALLVGYRATFWFCFATVVATLAVSIWGLRGIGKVGHKRD